METDIKYKLNIDELAVFGKHLEKYLTQTPKTDLLTDFFLMAQARKIYIKIQRKVSGIVAASINFAPNRTKAHSIKISLEELAALPYLFKHYLNNSDPYWQTVQHRIVSQFPSEICNLKYVL